VASRLPKSTHHEAALDIMSGLHEVGLLSAERLAEFESGCLDPPPPLTATEIAALRKREKLSEERFANALAVSVATVRKWEAGLQKPSGASARRLELLGREGLGAVLLPPNS